MAIKRLGIVGSGIMGSGIAECAARNGFEVVLRSRRQETADAMLAGMEKALAKQGEKGKVTVKDQAGFIVNALLFPYLNNAVRLLETGVATKEDIDEAMKGGCGFPMGPFALLDLVGLDTSLAILDALYDEYRDPNYSPVPLLRRMVTAELLGRKSGKGFYDYHR